MSWNIRKTKKYGITPLLKDCDKIPLLEWQQLVDNDEELMWAEESPIADAFKNAGHEWIKKENYRKQAYFDFNKKKNWAGLRLFFF